MRSDTPDLRVLQGGDPRWISPSPEHVVRERIRRRTRSLLARRVSLAAAVLAVVTAGTVLKPPGIDSASQVRMTDQEETTIEQGSAQVPLPEVGGGEADPLVDAPGRAVERTTKTATGLAPGALPSSPSAPKTLHPLVIDPAGDARYDGCATCPEQGVNEVRSSEPAFDVVAMDAACRAGTLTLSMTMLDFHAPAGENSMGVRPESAYYTGTLSFGDLDQLVFGFSRDMADDGITPNAQLYVSINGQSQAADLEGVSVRREASTLLLDIPLAALGKAAERMGGKASQAPKAGDAFAFSGSTNVDFNLRLTRYSEGADDVNTDDRERRYRLCD